jgi:hypothetical protein
MALKITKHKRQSAHDALAAVVRAEDVLDYMSVEELAYLAKARQILMATLEDDDDG